MLSLRTCALVRAFPLAFAGLLAASPPAQAQPDAESPYSAVFIDAKTEERLGPFPYDRKVYAEAIRALRKDGARAVVVKYFLDQSKTKEGDAALARELSLLPSFLQARIDEAEASPNPLPRRFTLQAATGADRLLGGDSGWIPSPAFSKACRGVGFVDLRSAEEPFNIPLIERYGRRIVPSLYLSVLQFALDGDIRLAAGSVAIGGGSVAIDDRGEFEVAPPPAKDGLEALSFVDLVEGRLPPGKFRRKIVVLGYDGDKQPAFKIPSGSIRAHRLFYHILLELHRKFSGKP